MNEIAIKVIAKVFNLAGIGFLVAGLVLTNGWYFVSGLMMIVGGSIMEAANGD